MDEGNVVSLSGARASHFVAHQVPEHFEPLIVVHAAPEAQEGKFVSVICLAFEAVTGRRLLASK